MVTDPHNGGATAGGVEGTLTIRLQCRTGVVEQATIDSSRPLAMPRIFVGRQPQQVVDTLPLIYSICGMAQGCAAAEALEQALALEPVAWRGNGRRLLVLLETAKEHLWRIQLDWARQLGERPEPQLVSGVTALIGAFRGELIGDGGLLSNPADGGRRPRRQQLLRRLDEYQSLLSELFGEPPERWLARAATDDLRDWWSHSETLPGRLLAWVDRAGWSALGTLSVTVLPALPVSWLREQLDRADAAGFIAAPEWQQQVAETTPFTRHIDQAGFANIRQHYGLGLQARLLSRLVELADSVRQLREGIASLHQPPPPAAVVGTGEGIAQLEASRGRLVHSVRLDQGVVSGYQILAPTEWNFHPRGVVTQGLRTLPAASPVELEQLARMWINAIDPCVGYSLAIDESGEGPHFS